ncbi:MAG: FAD-binding oxidoreductase [Sphingobacteriales bacterium]|nr:MAG: FAD-binding oxidoreductase [Sphingobacteriales bacterium]
MKSAKACYAWKASTLQPWKLTAHIMRDNIAKGANLQTYTAANTITKDDTGAREWTVHTDRGPISCNTIVHATNAYSGALEPSLTGIITPKPHICNRCGNIHPDYAEWEYQSFQYCSNHPKSCLLLWRRLLYRYYER